MLSSLTICLGKSFRQDYRLGFYQITFYPSIHEKILEIHIRLCYFGRVIDRFFLYALMDLFQSKWKSRLQLFAPFNFSNRKFTYEKWKYSLREDDKKVWCHKPNNKKVFCNHESVNQNNKSTPEAFYPASDVLMKISTWWMNS